MKDAKKERAVWALGAVGECGLTKVRTKKKGFKSLAIRSLKRRIELPMYTTSVGKWRNQDSWPDREDRRVVEPMDKVRALIVDDSSVIRARSSSVRCVRRASNWKRYWKPRTGPKRWPTLQGNVVDLILCDINMPVMDGLEFVRQVATVEGAKGVPIVMITTEGSESHVVAALSAGARGYIRKPFTPDQVKEHVLPLLGKKP